tara:strand:+ start:1525 stop:1767 length:243 start_codon:yes stop_codon:yes gene_type:complete
MTDQQIHLRAAPSKEAVVRYLVGEPNATTALIKSFIERSVLIGLGIHVFGEKDNIIRNSISASLAIEIYLLWYYGKQIKR